MTFENKQISCQEAGGRLSYKLGNLTLTCDEHGTMYINHKNQSDVIYLTEDGEDLLTLMVAHNKLLVDMGGGIKDVRHRVPQNEPTPVIPKASTRTDN